MQLVYSQSVPRPTWTRFFLTLGLGLVIVVGAAATTAWAQPAHLTNG